ncbi:putative delta-60 repeat protein [Tahibacter aquaticus]|uniref:Putative delta-60 repeat protein n=1 Tax=Tahibacter aquaticus TaxID=520092 RepID=A0A4R6YXZ6_9GAMM|nr:delta-60 repeat domain-containing protein [Tahibacter aquaticus]TDR43865.1 putative delta-60 repeat protein [Tahibacter aquaticus]
MSAKHSVSRSRRGTLGAKIIIALALSSCSTFSHANRADLDLAFGVDGVVRLAVSNGGFNDVLVQPDGRIVAAGMSGTDWLVARFNSDGSLDSGFGNGGVRTVTPPATVPSKAQAVTLDSSGRVMVAGGRFVVRLDTSGNLDPSYGTGGIYTPPLGPDHLGLTISDIIVSSDGGFLLSCIVAAYYVSGPQVGPNISALKLTSAGVVDTSFGVAGYALQIANSQRIRNETYAVAEWNGNIYVAGGTSSSTFTYNTAELIRFTAAGAVDTTFGNNGILVPFPTVSWDPNNAVTEIAMQPPFGLIAAGAGAITPSLFDATRVGRITAAGQVDAGFVDAGIVRQPLPLVSGLLVDGDSRVVIASTTPTAPIVASLLPNGASDPDFGTAGQRNVPFDGQPATALALQADGKYLLAGGEGSSVAYLARLHGTAVFPPEVTTTPPAGTTLSASGGAPGVTQSLGAIQFVNSGGGDLIVSGCTASAGFSAGASFPLTVTQAAPQNVAVACQMPAAPLTTVSGTLTCNTNDGDEPQVTFALQCTSGTGAPGATAIPTLAAGAKWLLGGLLTLLAVVMMRRPLAARGAKAR